MRKKKEAKQEPKEIIGRMACPVCGKPNQNLKVNKNGNLYIYCDSRCSTRFNAQESREFTDELRQGRTVRHGNLVIVPVGVPEVAKIEVKTTKTEVKDDGKPRGDTINGRTDTGFAGSSRDRTEQRPIERFASWLWGDDDE